MIKSVFIANLYIIHANIPHMERTIIIIKSYDTLHQYVEQELKIYYKQYFSQSFSQYNSCLLYNYITSIMISGNKTHTI